MPIPPEFPEFAPPSGRRLPRRLSRLLGLVGLALMLVLASTIGAMGLARALAVDSSGLTAGGTHLGLSLDAPEPDGTVAVVPHTRKRPEPPPTPTAVPSTPAATAPGTTSNGCVITATDSSAEQSLLALLNKHRAAAGVAPLKLSATLSVVSREHTCDMMTHHIMGHDGSDGSTPLQRIQSTGLAFSNWGENVGTSSGLGLMGGITEIDNGMMSEPLTPYDHHWNIVNAAFTQVGLGVLYVNGQVWLTEDFIG